METTGPTWCRVAVTMSRGSEAHVCIESLYETASTYISLVHVSLFVGSVAVFTGISEPLTRERKNRVGFPIISCKTPMAKRVALSARHSRILRGREAQHEN